MIKAVVDVCENPKVLSKIDKLQEAITCISKLLDICKIYITGKKYVERKKVINDLMGMRVSDFVIFDDEKFNLIQKKLLKLNK
ncbi:MAG: hypothetical protein SOR59_03815 [Lachnospiraceae bacterium]|nr:hypothetical protein [Lachnospiraceae bacterium]